jgi:outer membrane beta-barrel protein
MSVSIYAAEDDLYDFLWLDPDKKVYVLQNKVYEKKKTNYVELGLITGLNSNFQSTTGIHFSGGRYFTEEFGVEVTYNKYSNNDDDSYTSIRQVNGAVPFVRRISAKAGINAIWSPFYGKVNTFNKIIYFDWSFGLGLGQIKTQSNGDTVSNAAAADQYKEESHMAVLTKTAFKIHLNKSFNIGVTYSMDHYKSRGPNLNNGSPRSENWGTNNEAMLSVGFNF